MKKFLLLLATCLFVGVALAATTPHPNRTVSEAIAANLPATFAFILAVLAMLCELLYALFKKHKTGPVATKWDLLERRFVEFSFLVLGGGSASGAIFNLFGGG